MSTSTLDALFAVWKSVHSALVAGALGFAPALAAPVFQWVYRHHEHATVRTLAATGLVWSAVVLVVAVPALAVQTHPTYDFGLSALLFLAISLAAALTALASIVALSWRLEATWPIFAGVAIVLLVLASAKLKREAHEWEGWRRATNDAKVARRAFLRAHPLHRAIEEGDAREAERLAASLPLPELEARDPDGDTALHRAASEGLRRTVEVLLDRGVPASAEASAAAPAPAERTAPVDLAIRRLRWDVVELFLARGAVPGRDGGHVLLEWNPELFVAARLPPDVVQTAVVELIRDPDAHDDHVPRALDAVLRCTFDPDGPVAHPAGAEALTPLGHAVDVFWDWHGRKQDTLRLVRWLLAHGADPNASVRGPGKPGPTPLRMLLASAPSSSEARLEIEPLLDTVDALLEAGARADDGEQCPLGALLVGGFLLSLDAAQATLHLPYATTDDEARRRVAEARPTWGPRFLATLRRFAKAGARFDGRACEGAAGDVARALPEIEALLPEANRTELSRLVDRRR